MKTRTDLLNALIKRYDLKSYCELGTQVRSINFDKIECGDKFCVDIDPNAKADFTGSTDDFFKQLNRSFDLYFVDASHYAEDVKRDFENALQHLTPNGIICLHDCNPEKEEHTIVPRPMDRGHWNGSCYRFAIMLCHPSFTSEPSITINIDNGMTIFSNRKSYKLYDFPIPHVAWSDFEENRIELLNLISWDEFIKL